MAKPMAVTLPFVLLLLDCWPLNRWPVTTATQLAPAPFPRQTWRRLLLEKIPLLALVGIACKLTIAAQQAAMVSTRNISIVQRLLHVAVAYAHYVIAVKQGGRFGFYVTGQISLNGLSKLPNGWGTSCIVTFG